MFSKGQVISKSFFGVFNFFQKTNKNTSHSSKTEFIRWFFEEFTAWQFVFEINWPLNSTQILDVKLPNVFDSRLQIKNVRDIIFFPNNCYENYFCDNLNSFFSYMFLSSQKTNFLSLQKILFIKKATRKCKPNCVLIKNWSLGWF